MKKFISFLTAILLCASTTLASACQFNDSSSSSPISSIEESSSFLPEIIEPCEEHTFGEWETVKEASCVSGEKQRVCETCAFTETEEIPALNDFFAHTFDENTLCTTCGHQEFIESEEYMEEIIVFISGFGSPQPSTGTLWWNKDRTYGLKILCSSDHVQIKGFTGTPIHVQIPAYYDGIPIKYINQPEPWSDEGTFKNCTTLKSIYIPDTVERISAYAFDGCTNLESVRFSENLENIGGCAFRNCSSLTEIKIPMSVWSFGQLVFQNCTSLIEVTMPPEFTHCDWLLFDNCPSIKTVRISKNSDISKKFFENSPDCKFIYYD